MNVKEILTTEFAKLISELEQRHVELGMKASGDWIASLESDISDKEASILANDYTTYLVNGREPNKKQTHKELVAWAVWAGNTFIKDWVKSKGLNLNPIGVAYNIAKKGTKYHQQGGTDLIESVITEERIKQISTQLNNSLVTEVTKLMKV